MCEPRISASKLTPVSYSVPILLKPRDHKPRRRRHTFSSVVSDEGSEVLGLSEFTVHGSKADIGDRIQH